MKDQETNSLRNVAVISHGHSGKTSLVEALLFSSGHVGRLGSTAAGSATTDFGEDEHAREFSIRLGLAHVLHDGVKINLIDTPGFANFLHDARVGLSVADTALVVVDAVHGIEVQTERTWAHADTMALPARVVVINKMDRENADFDRVVKTLSDGFGRRRQRRGAGDQRAA